MLPFIKYTLIPKPEYKKNIEDEFLSVGARIGWILDGSYKYPGYIEDFLIDEKEQEIHFRLRGYLKECLRDSLSENWEIQEEQVPHRPWDKDWNFNINIIRANKQK